ncbi:hypothetical protein GQ44DRAFT_777727 [Phaeosphaeriaceae sp. PMI808]|nr:hypothetical protein GQ44DRAFT_777727 [Phaeosphaeriaceae sp. PMI808]
MLPPNVPANFVNLLARADQGLETRNSFITTLYPVDGFDILQACSKWCLEGRCHDEQGPPGCKDFMPNNGSPDEASFIKKYKCSQPGCICDPINRFYQRTIENAYTCLNSSCRRKDTICTEFKAEADQVKNAVKNYCMSHNITGDYTSNHPQLPTCDDATTSSHPQESNRWKAQDIASLTVAIFAALVPFIIIIIQFFRLRQRRARASQTARTANHPAANQPVADQFVANQPAAIQPAANQPAANQPAANQPAAN